MQLTVKLLNAQQTQNWFPARLRIRPATVSARDKDVQISLFFFTFDAQMEY